MRLSTTIHGQSEPIHGDRHQSGVTWRYSSRESDAPGLVATPTPSSFRDELKAPNNDLLALGRLLFVTPEIHSQRHCLLGNLRLRVRRRERPLVQDMLGGSYGL